MNSADAGEAVRTTQAASARREKKLRDEGRSLRIDSASPWDVKVNDSSGRPRFAPSRGGKPSKPVAVELASGPLKTSTVVKGERDVKGRQKADAAAAKREKASLRRELMDGARTSWTPAHIERLAASDRPELRKLRKQFGDALEREFAGENLAFLAAVCKFKRIGDPAKRQKAQQQIVERYIDERADHAVNISAKARQDIANGKGDATVFDSAFKAILDDLAKDRFPRFMAARK